MRRGLTKTLVVAILTAAGLGVLMAAIQFAGVHTPIRRWPRGILVWTTISLWWSPVVGIVEAIWRRAGSRARVAAMLTPIGVIAIALQPLWLMLIVRTLGGHTGTYAEIFVAWLDTNIVVFLGISGAWWAAQQRQRSEAANQDYILLRTSIEDARLHVLALQLQPHFIFNTLNLVSELAYRDVSGAVATLRDLRSLLTESLGHAFHRETTLREELKFLRAYLTIQQRRFRDRLTVTIDVDESVMDAAVPHFALQPIVENSIIHGLSPLSRGGTVAVAATRAEDRLVLSVTDDGAGFNPPLSHEGIGLTNTRLRLEQLYPNENQLTLKRGRPDGVVSTIVIPYRERATQPEREDLVTAELIDNVSNDVPVQLRISSRVLIATVWLLVAAAWTQIDSVSRLLGAPRPAFGLTAWINLVGAVLWMALTPLVIWIAQRADLTSKRSLRTYFLHLIAASAMSLVHVTAWIAASDRIVPPADNTIRRDLLPWLAWNVLAYFVIVAFASVATLAARRREKAAETMLAQAELRKTRMSALRLRLQPQIIVQSLDLLSIAVTRDARQAERAITRMGNMLRILLDSASRDFVLLDDELALLDTYADVARAGGSEDRARASCVQNIDVTSRHETIIAAVTLVPLAAALGGTVRSVSIVDNDAMLEIDVITDGSNVDELRLAELKHRLTEAYKSSVEVSWRREEQDFTLGRCVVPLRTTGVVDWDESWSAIDSVAAIA